MAHHFAPLVRVFADCLLMQLESGQKTWGQIIADYAPSAPWILYGSDPRHFLLLADLLVALFERRNAGTPKAQDLLAEQGDNVLAAAVCEVLFRERSEALRLASSRVPLFIQRPMLLSTNTPPQYCKDLLAALAAMRRPSSLGATLQIIYSKASVFSTHEPLLDRLELALEIAQTQEILGGKLLKGLLARAPSWDVTSPRILAILGRATMRASEQGRDSASLDALDWYLYTLCCSQGIKFSEGPAAEPVSALGNFLLMRLTSVWLSRLEDHLLFVPRNVLILLGSALHACSVAELTAFLRSLLGVVAGGRDRPGIEPLLAMIIQSLLSGPQSFLRLPANLVLSLLDPSLAPPVLPEAAPERLEEGEEFPVPLQFRQLSAGPAPKHVLLLRLAKWTRAGSGSTELFFRLIHAARESADGGRERDNLRTSNQSMLNFEQLLASEGLVVACCLTHPLYNKFI